MVGNFMEQTTITIMEGGNNMKPLLTIAEAAERLGLSYQTAYKWVERGELPTVRVAGRRRVPAAALDEILRRWNDQALSAVEQAR
jgi:excisionase family DNA binding protein